MKQLLLVRHAKSDWSDGTLRDFDRPLNDRGEHDAPRMAKFLVGQHLAPTLLYSSPANRALATAKLFSPILGIAEDEIQTDETLYEAFTHQILSAITTLNSKHDIVAMFSHNPSISSAAAQFSEDYLAPMPTCAVAHIVANVEDWKEFTPTTAVLKNVWSPKDVLDEYA